MIPRIIPIITSISLLFTASASAQFLSRSTASGDNDVEFSKRMPRQQNLNGNVRSAETTGWTIYRYETLADAASFALAQESPGRLDITGSVVVPGEQWRVRFYFKDDADKYFPVADVLFDDANGHTVVPGGAVAPLSAAELAMIKAGELVETTQALPCEDSEYKTVVIPSPSGDGSICVYRLRESMEAGRIPEGQHMRYNVSADGSTITAQREFARRCNMPSIGLTDGSGNTPEFNLTHTMDSQPTEVHIYLSLRYDVSIYLATLPSNLYWRIIDGTAWVD